ALWYKKAIETDPDYDLAHLNLAVSLIELGELETARIHAEKAAQLDPGTHLAQVDELMKKIQVAKIKKDEEM
ncbi:MAG TPA: tetratricopeptide repeat protein, partial [Candidatus Ozemobacteraceae bacterium]|nr:tetratricopeptide repeat protein [Candidatus Ozemobacteraceae bacterium]